METLTKKTFNLEDGETKNLIERITKSYIDKNKEEFLKVAKEIGEAALKTETKEEEEMFNENFLKIIKELPDPSALAITQVCIVVKAGERVANEVLGLSDELFRYLKNVIDKLENDPEITEIKRGEAFYC